MVTLYFFQFKVFKKRDCGMLDKGSFKEKRQKALLFTFMNKCNTSFLRVFLSVVFWFGDLNFRIEDYDIHVVKCAIDSNKLPLLWERDQVVHLLIFWYF